MTDEKLFDVLNTILGVTVQLDAALAKRGKWQCLGLMSDLGIPSEQRTALIAMLKLLRTDDAKLRDVQDDAAHNLELARYREHAAQFYDSLALSLPVTMLESN